MYYLGIDLGGTNIAAAVVDEGFGIVGRGSRKTNIPRPAVAIADDMAAAARDAAAAAGLRLSDITSCGIGSPGSVNTDTGMVYVASNLRFENVPLKSMMEERLGLPVLVHNDANSAALGEMLAGAGRGTRDFVAITLGTGVGGGVIMHNRMLTGSNYAGGELGHMTIEMDGELCPCGRRGCWEAYASATALIAQTRRAMEAHPESVMWKLSAESGGKVSGRTAFDAMRAGDPTGTDVVNRYTVYVAEGVANVINIFQPEVLCVGGGIANEGETLLAPVREYVSHVTYSKNNPRQTEIKAAALGNDAGIIGAAFLHTLGE